MVRVRGNVADGVDAVEALDGSLVRIGEALLAVQGTGNSCPGLYAVVGEPGSIRIGDSVESA